MILRFLPLLLFILLPTPAWADDLGCYTSGGTVAGARAQFSGTATSVTAKVVDKDDALASPYATPTMTDRGENNWSAADFTAGSTVGVHTVRYSATVNSQTVYGADTFVLATSCPSTQASVDAVDDFVDTEVTAIKAKTDSLNFTIAGIVDSNAIRVDGAALGTHTAGSFPADVRQVVGTAAPQTSGELTVRVSDGTGTGQIDTLNGAVGTVTNLTNVPGAVTVTVSTGATVNNIPIQETTVITSTISLSGRNLVCNGQRKTILRTTDGSPDRIFIDETTIGNVFSSAPTNGTVCTVE